jgi:hypothetical protein
MLVAVTVLPLPTFASAKVLGPAAEQVTLAVSPASTPVREQAEMFAALVLS